MTKKIGLKSAVIYSIATVTGIGMIPVTVDSIFFGKDHVTTEFDLEFQAVYETCIETLNNVGEVSKENKENWEIKGEAGSCNISIKLTKTKHGKTKIKLSARKLLVPKQKIAGGILHEIIQNMEQ